MRKIRFVLYGLGCAALCLALLGGFTDYLGPTFSLQVSEIFNGKESKEVLALAPIISAEGAILMNAETGEVIYEKDADKRLYPASTTKIMTALVALEMMDEIGADFSSKVTVPGEAVGIEGSSLYLKMGEKVTAEELLYGTMLQSGNDAATCLALCVSGDLDVFVERMNKTARKLGCRNTNFVNPSGLTHENHYTAARDLALIGREAMKRDDFRKIAGAKSWSENQESSSKNSADQGTARSFKNKNETVSEYEGATGIKIGYTKASGRTLVASAKRDETELIAVVLNDSNWFQDAYALLDYGFARMADE